MDGKIVFMVIGLFTYMVVSEAGEHFKIDNDQYYLSHPLKKNWYEALRHCIYHSMVLVDINDEAENNRILSIITNPKYVNDSSPQYWTSGTDLGSEGQFYWASSAHSMIYSDFHATNPDNAGNENCVEIRGDYDWKWNDHVCEQKKYFICRKSVSYPVINQSCITSLGDL